MSASTKVRRRTRAEERRRLAQRRQQRRRLALLGVIGAAAAGLAVIFVVMIRQPEPTAPTGSSTALAGRAFPIEGRTHVPEGTEVQYRTSPPSSGDHWPEPAPWGIYREPLPDEQLVHNLEHGGIWISYEGIDQATRRRLERLAGRYPEAVILTPRPENDRRVFLVSWGRIDELATFEEQRIVAFISANINKSPEPLATLPGPSGTGVEVGAPFPTFSLTDAHGQTVSNATLAGKPSIVWFTTSYCEPCKVGARVVAALDDELGGDAFNVLVLFVDPAEPPAALLDWRSEVARDDWIVALDTALATEVDLRFLDTKYLLDEAGVIQDIDVNIADQRYVELVRGEVQGGAP